MGSKNKKKEGGDEGGKWKKKPIEDERFAKANYDPRFQNVAKHKSKVIIDQRFHRIFTDKSFKNNSSSSGVDKRGKAKTHSQSESDISRYYHFDVDINPETNDKKKKKKVVMKGKVVDDDDDDDDESSESGSEELPDPELSDDTDADDAEVSGDDASLEVEEVPLIEKETHRLAVVNMDWTQVKAVDLFVMLSSCLNKEGQIKSVAVYPSEFGLKRMEEEAVRGPVALFENDQKIDEGDEDSDSDDDDDDEISDTEKDADDVSDYEDADDVSGGEDVDVDEGFVGSDSEEGDEDSMEEDGGDDNGDEDDDEDDDEDEEDDDIDSEKLRAYEKSRLRYYYGVVECDSVATADYLYKACDGIEFERSSNVLDLRFIPDSMEFKHEARDVATEAPAEYEGLDFHTRALQQSNTVLSWDDDEPHRVKTLRRNFTEKQLAEMELNEFLASDESESDEDENGNQDLPEKKKKKADMYRALLQSGDGSEEEDEGQNMEVTFATGLEDISKKIIEKKEKGSETVFEAYLRKKKEKKDAQKNRSKTSSDNDSDDESDDDRTSRDPDDFFEEPPSLEKSKKAGRGKKKKAEKVELEKEEAEAASKAELELLLADDNGAEKKLKGYNIKHKKAKGKNAKDIPDKTNLPNVEIDDPRFAALFNNPVFALDPTDPQFKRSATYYRQLAQKNQQKSSREHDEDAEPVEPSIPEKDHLNGTSQKDKHELSAMIKSLKMKAQQLSAPSTVKRKDMDSNGQTMGKKKHKLPGSDRSSKKARHHT